jgi:outer membrane receptor protein involved in Fe transport
LVHTNQISKGVLPDLNNITYNPGAGSITQVPSAGDRTYNDVLPSLNLKYSLTEDLVLRLAASRTMSRPTLTQLSPTVTASGANFDFLPKPLDGLGFLGNCTYLQSHGGTLPLIGASKNNYTASIYYEKGWFGGRVTYTYRGKFYTSTEGNTRDDVWEQPFGTLDANVTSGIGDHVSLVFEANNILQDTNRQRFEPIDVISDYFDNGRRIPAGVRATF